MNTMHAGTPSRFAGRTAIAIAMTTLLVCAGGGAATAATNDDDSRDAVSRDGRPAPIHAGAATYTHSFRGSGVPAPEVVRIEDPPADVRPAIEASSVRSELASIESVIGTDQRFQVTDTTEFPYRAIAYLLLHFPSDSNTYVCTGWFIGPHTLGTAGHCVYSTILDEWASSITVYPGRSSSTLPYGSASAIDLFSVKGWTTKHDDRFDYGAIEIDADLGNTVGWFGFYHSSDDTFFDDRRIKIFGYPASAGATMWGMVKRVKAVAAKKMYYNIDTSGGESGSPVWSNKAGCGACAYAIHAYSTGGQPYPQWNSGTRIDQSVVDKLTAWEQK